MIKKPTATINLREASLAGGGVGTFLAGCIGLLPDGGPKRVLILFVPALTAISTGLWIYLKASYLDPLLRQQRTAKYDAAISVIDKLLAVAKANLAEAERNPNSSKTLITELQKTIEKLQRQKSEKLLEQAQHISFPEEEED